MKQGTVTAYSMEFVENKTILNLSSIEESYYQTASNIKVTKTNQTNGTTFDITYTQTIDGEDAGQLSMQITRDGNINSNNIKYNLSIGYIVDYMGSSMEINITGEESINFVSDVNIVELEEGSYTILNNLSEEELQLTLMDSAQKLSQKLGLDQYLDLLTGTSMIDENYYTDYDMTDTEYDFADEESLIEQAQQAQE